MRNIDPKAPLKCIQINGLPIKLELFLNTPDNPLLIKLPVTYRTKEGEKFVSEGDVYQLKHKIKVSAFEYKMIFTILQDQ
ncbi:hypothetical protein F0316_18300 [Vibrio cholerae]|uniref:hypothetical protein n=1 Tax=Vibrio cholerae TaxID=666 RepID=UPI0011F1BF36|nr:hypothetical protein [Vibrio cholerae]QEO43525.1 hypothetical protein F0316_18300 [Vibrio cholerae]